MTIKINGTVLAPQPARTFWKRTALGQNLNGTGALGAYETFVILAPKLLDQAFNWTSFENQVLSSLTAYAPGSGPLGTAVTYSGGVVSREIRQFEMPEDRSVSGVELEILVIV